MSTYFVPVLCQMLDIQGTGWSNPQPEGAHRLEGCRRGDSGNDLKWNQARARKRHGQHGSQSGTDGVDGIVAWREVFRMRRFLSWA